MSYIRTDHSFLVLIRNGVFIVLKCINVPYLKNAAVIWFHMRCACSMDVPYKIDHSFLVLIRNGVFIVLIIMSHVSKMLQ